MKPFKPGYNILKELKMSLSKEAIADWIQQRYADDYFKFDLICSEVTVESYQQEGSCLTVVYAFWDDGHSVPDCQDYFLFDLEVASKYEVNFPRGLQLVRCTDKYGWSSLEECQELSQNLIEIEEADVDVEFYKWGAPEVEKFIEGYVDYLGLDKELMAEMLIEAYGAKNGLPSFIPQCLVPHFEKIVAEYS